MVETTLGAELEGHELSSYHLWRALNIEGWTKKNEKKRKSSGSATLREQNKHEVWEITTRIISDYTGVLIQTSIYHTPEDSPEDAYFTCMLN